MDRRQFLATGSAVALGSTLISPSTTFAGPGYASPAEAMKAPRESVLHVIALYDGTPIRKPGYLATVDVDANSKSYSQVIHRLPVSTMDDELHHFGWNACSSCHGDEGRERRYLIVPGLKSGNIHIIDASNPKKLERFRTIPAEAIIRKTNLTAPHTVHCLADGNILISMLGDKDGDGPGGFLLLDSGFNIVGRWEKDATGMHFNYDFWYQPRHNVMVSSEWAAPKTYGAGFNPADVAAGKYGQRLHFWNWKERRIAQTIDLGATGQIPLEVRFLHDPASVHGFVGAALSSTVWHWYKAGEMWKVDKVIEVPNVNVATVPFPVPGLITDSVISMDDRYLYFSNWLHGDIRQYDIRDPFKPKLVGQLFLGGLIGKTPMFRGEKLRGGPQMLQLSLDGKRLYVTNSLLSSWDHQFYPDMTKQGSHLLQVDIDTDKGGLALNERFFVDFGKEPDGPARAHEMRYPGGDCTSDIFA